MSIFLRCALAFVTSLVGTASAATVTYYHNDLAGSPVVATNESGTVIWRESYRPYGERTVNSASAGGNKVWFTSRRQDAATGLVYMGARYYDPVIGRFISTDPSGFDEQSVHGFNRYAYANNNPYRYVDPDGRTPQAAQAMFRATFALATLLGAKELGERLSGRAWILMNESGDQPGSNRDAPRPKSAAEVLTPDGEPVGNVQGGATPDVRTVKPGELDEVIDGLKGLGAKPASKPNYPGDWFDLPNNQGGFGIRDSKGSGRTVDVKIPDVPDVTKIHQKP
jgi:RHS repeat-associated protein